MTAAARLVADQASITAWFGMLHGDTGGHVALSYEDASGRFHGIGGSYTDRDQAVRRVLELDRRGAKGIYARVTSLRAAPDPDRRGSVADSLALPALWADVDFGDVGHKHDPARHGGLTLPPDADAAQALVHASGLPAPSVLVHSGGGLYPIWRLDPPHVIDDDLAELEELSTRWQQILAAAFAAAGHHYGTGVGDLARVLRIPGTVNRKAGGQRPCRFLAACGAVYTLEELRAAAVELYTPPARRQLPPPARPATPRPSGTPGRGPFDALDAHATWADILTPAGWTPAPGRPGPGVLEEWSRPGDPEHPVSARVLAANPHALVVWSESAGLPTGRGQALTKGRVFAHLHHRGDTTAAARDLIAAATGGHATGPARSLPPQLLAAVAATRPVPLAGLTALSAPPDHREYPPVTEPPIADEPPPPEDDPPPAPARKLVLTPASAIKPRRVRWLWHERLALGTLGLLAGGEGLGKSTIGYWLAGRITRGEMPGEYLGRPRGVLVCATEDSWEHTIVPRLMAAGADLDRVFRVEIITADEIHVGLSLPRDVHAVEQAALQVQAGLMLLDPLMSRLDAALDTHKDGPVRQALEPLAALADRADMAILGLIHHNKSGSSDPLQVVMASKAFTAVARSVHTVVRDPDDDTGERRLFGTSKNNLGRTDLPTLGYTVVGHPIDTDDGTAWTGRLDWSGEVAGTIREAMSRSQDVDGDRSATAEAKDWLEDYLTSQGGEAAKADVEKAGRAAGHHPQSVRRARERLRLEHRRQGFPSVTIWSLPVHSRVSPDTPSRAQPARGDDTTNTTDTSGPDQAQRPDPDAPVVSVVSVGSTPREQHTTDDTTAPGALLGDQCPSCKYTRGQHRHDCPRREAS